jgi:hypothetical protein
MFADPFMVIVPPVSMYSSNHMVCTAPIDFATNFLNVVVPAAVTASVRVDGAAPPVAFFPIGGGYSGAQIPIPAGPHQISAAAPISVTVYGWAEYDSYGWPGCLFFGDTTPPTVTCLVSNVTITLQPGSTSVCSAQVPDLRGQVDVTDNCASANGMRIEQDPPPGTPVGGGVHPIRVTATDPRGNADSCVITLTVVDPSEPQIFCPSNLVRTCTSPAGAVVSYAVQGRTSCGTPLQASCNPPPGSLFPPGNTLVTCSVTNDFGKLAICQFTVTVRCLNIQPLPNGGGLTIVWSGNGALETTDKLGGAWTRLPNATSPFRVDSTGSQQFFRVRFE